MDNLVVTACGQLLHGLNVSRKVWRMPGKSHSVYAVSLKRLGFECASNRHSKQVKAEGKEALLFPLGIWAMARRCHQLW